MSNIDCDEQISRLENILNDCLEELAPCREENVNSAQLPEYIRTKIKYRNCLRNSQRRFSINGLDQFWVAMNQSDVTNVPYVAITIGFNTLFSLLKKALLLVSASQHLDMHCSPSLQKKIISRGCWLPPAATLVNRTSKCKRHS
nr:unnamed protein product [Callosobruchus analis]